MLPCCREQLGGLLIGRMGDMHARKPVSGQPGIVFADIPRNPTGKIEKPKLREIYGGKGLVEAQNLG